MQPSRSIRFMGGVGFGLLLAAFTAGAAAAQSLYDCGPVTSLPLSECQALVSLYDSTGGTGWVDQTGWLTAPDPCDWQGITCAAGHVTEIELVSNQLTGTLPPALGQLPNLTVLDLSGEYVAYPVGASNSLSGPLPDELGSLTQLQILNLSHNLLSGAPPASLIHLTALRQMILSYNQLSGPLPGAFGALTQLEVLRLDHNQLTGSIPVSFGSLAALTELGLSANYLSGGLPSALGQLSQLDALYLDRNALRGEVPAALAGLTSLSFLDVSYNGLKASDPAAAAFLNAHQSDWASTQTVPPAGVVAENLPGAVRLSWQAIPLPGPLGNYRIGAAEQVGDPFVQVGKTANLSVTSFTIPKASLAGASWLGVRSYTAPHPENSNEIFSAYAGLTFDASSLLTLSLSGPTSARSGATLPYTLTLTNLASLPQTAITVTLPLPSTAHWVSGGTLLTGLVRWTVPTLAAHASVSLPLTLTGDATFSLSGQRAVSNEGELAEGTPLTTEILPPVGGQTALIYPDQATTIVFTHTQAATITLEVPAGAVTQTLRLAYSDLPLVSGGLAGLHFSGLAFKIDPYQGSTALGSLPLLLPVSLSVDYREAQMAGLDELGLTLGLWNGTAWTDAATTCTPASVYTRDADNNRLSLGLCHLSPFGLFAPQAERRLYLPFVVNASP